LELTEVKNHKKLAQFMTTYYIKNAHFNIFHNQN